MKKLHVKNQRLQALFDSIKWWQEILIILFLWAIVIGLFYVTVVKAQ